MSLDRKKSDCQPEECLLKKRRSLKHENSMRNEEMSHENIGLLRMELENETKRRNDAQCRYVELSKQVDALMCSIEESKNCPDSKYDALIAKQNCVNDTISSQLHEAKDRLAGLTHSLKSIQVCGKELKKEPKDNSIIFFCDKMQQDLTKEIKRFERMQIDLKSNLDRLQWRLDCESKEYFALLDQFQKLQIELYYLQNLNDKYSMRGLF